jgi:glyoxylase-like metal-dependent hydrolase (beta-lactamase superfamily II)/ferredoxin
MASIARRLASNVDGDFYVDDSCIDCGACRWIAPDSFDDDDSGSYARVYRQPRTASEEASALRALVSCPTGSIGSVGEHALAPVVASFPRPITADVYHCGFHSEASFGAASYLVTRREGNVLVDSPRFHRGLVRRIEALGGVALMFLTHCDDVAEHRRFARAFGCRRVIHERDVRADTADVEVKLRGDDEVTLGADLLAIPTPGHTRGSACLLFRGSSPRAEAPAVLFSGDHLAFSRARGHVYAFRDACWYDWGTQIESMERLARHDFEWILPGHGAPCHFPAGEMRGEIDRCVRWMRGAG